MKPITGIAGCCARAASGHAAAPPINVMNSRRFTDASRASPRQDSTPRHGRLLHPSTWAVRDDRGHAADNFFQGGSPKTGHPTYRASNLFHHQKIVLRQISEDEAWMKI